MNGEQTLHDGPIHDMSIRPTTAGDLIERGDTIAQVRTPYTTAIAVQRPRNLADVERRVLEESELIGEDGLWGWDVNEKQADGSYKKKWIEGPSIELAKILHRNWGNCACPCESVVETATRYIITPWWIDLETGVTFSRPYRQNKAPNTGKGPKGERAEDMKFQIGVSKAIRNVILAGMPSWLVTRAMDKCKEGVKSDLEAYILEIDKRRYRDMKDKPTITWDERQMARQQRIVDAMVKRFANYTVTLDMLENALERKSVTWKIEEFVRLTTMIRSLESGAQTVKELFEVVETEAANPADETQKPQPTSGLNLDLGDPADNKGHTDDAPKPTASVNTGADDASARTTKGKARGGSAPE